MMRVRRWIWSVGWLALVGCGDDVDEPSATLDAGLDAMAVVPAQDAGGDGSALDAAPLDAALDATSPTMCAKYGGAANIERYVKEHVIAELADDCRIGLHFRALPADRLARFGDCLAIQMQELFACAGVIYRGSRSPNGLLCRDMKTAHQNLGLSMGDFEALVGDLAEGLRKAGVAQADIDTVVPALTGLSPDVVESPTRSPSRACADAGAVTPGG